MFVCFKCGKKFDADDYGHVDDHFEICKDCHPWFVDMMQLKKQAKPINLEPERRFLSG